MVYYCFGHATSHFALAPNTPTTATCVDIAHLSNFGCVLVESCLIAGRFCRQVFQVSDLSAFDGRILAHHGSDGEQTLASDSGKGS